MTTDTPGIVYLVGAGPGDPELLTLRAHRLLQRCDALVHDSLVPMELLELVPEGCEIHAVGKRRGHHSVPQPSTNALLQQLAGRCRCVVRLKGGDPFLFGRGGEEVNRLKKELRQLTGKKDAQINISEVKRPELDAALVGANIAHQLKKKISYRRVVNKTIQSTMRMGAEGIRINVAGRLGGVEIARSEKFSDGSVPLHTLRADIDYALTEAHTQYGVIGIKVWICSGQFTR